MKRRPILVLLTSHWLSMVGTALVTFAGLSWLFLLPLHGPGAVSNPYIGLLAFVALPLVFFLGLALIPVGIVLSRRHGTDRTEIPWRRVGLFFGLTTVVNIIIGSQLTYRAVEHMDTVSFCGQTCHVMKPEFTAHLSAPHQRVACVSCHVAPGAGGWLQAKTAGTRQLVDVLLDRVPTPIEPALQSQRLVSSVDTCEQCHAREAVVGTRIRVKTQFADNEANTQSWTVLNMRADGIHKAHMGPGVQIRYAAQDRQRQRIPWVESTNLQTGVARTYRSPAAKSDAPASLTTFEMQCVDCHNRPAHRFESAESAVDQALARGELPVALPFLRKTSLALLRAAYGSEDEAAKKIPQGLAESYRKKYPGAPLDAAALSLVAIYRRNVFPDLKVTWGTYPSNLGHTDAPGCFRCHDNEHTSAEKKAISQDCDVCHQVLAVDETSPEALKALGIH